MTHSAFYSNLLFFVARRSDAPDARTQRMMEILRSAADAFQQEGRYIVSVGEFEVTARAFAGVAGFLQKQILPEAVAAGHTEIEEQVRCAIDHAMDSVNTLLSRAGLGLADQDVVLLPPSASPSESTTRH